MAQPLDLTALFERLGNTNIDSGWTEQEMQCASCHQETVSKVKLACGHFFHAACILPWIKSQSEEHGKADCPLCREKITLLSPAHSLEDSGPTNPIGIADTLFPKTLVLNHIRHALNHHFPNSSSAQALPKDPSEHSVCIALKILFPHQQEIQALPDVPSVDQLVKALQNALPEDPQIQSIPATYVLALMKSTLLAHFKAKGVKEADIDDALKISSYPSAQDLVRILNSHFSVSDLPDDPAFLCQAFETIFPNFFSIIPSGTQCSICLEPFKTENPLETENPLRSGILVSDADNHTHHIECAPSLWEHAEYPVRSVTSDSDRAIAELIDHLGCWRILYEVILSRFGFWNTLLFSGAILAAIVLFLALLVWMFTEPVGWGVLLLLFISYYSS